MSNITRIKNTKYHQKRGIFYRKNVNFCLKNAEGAIIFKNANFEIIIL